MDGLNLLGKVIDTTFYIDKSSIQAAGEFVESFRPNQLKCKSWLVNEIANTNTNFNKVLVVGAWNGVLLYELMSKHCNVTWFDFLDLDEKTHIHRNVYFELNKMEKNYNSILCDANEFSDFKDYDLIINTSCEHMKPLPTVNGPLYALQSNNYTSVKDHINCVNSADELKEQYNLTQTVFKGNLNMGHYERFMIIGSHW